MAEKLLLEVTLQVGLTHLQEELEEQVMNGYQHSELNMEIAVISEAAEQAVLREEPLAIVAVMEVAEIQLLHLTVNGL